MNEHSFAVCAYKESPWLESCLRSLAAQRQASEVFLATSTPSAFLREVAEKYGLPLHVNEAGDGIARDWNFAYGMARTPYVTIAHQDDWYHPQYSARAAEKLRAAGKDALIYFCDYEELRGNRLVRRNALLAFKRLLLLPLRPRPFQRSRFLRRRVLSLGNPICCPSVAFCRENLPERPFSEGFRSNLDWEAWERLGRLPGAFAYDPFIGMRHRIHEGSETTRVLAGNARTEEDRAMFGKFWPAPVALALARAYKASEKSNGTDQ